MTPSSLPDLEQLIASMLQGLLNSMKHPTIIKQTIVLDDSVQWSLVVARPLIEFTYTQNKPMRLLLHKRFAPYQVQSTRAVRPHVFFGHDETPVDPATARSKLDE
jgi:hypothetical protein